MEKNDPAGGAAAPSESATVLVGGHPVLDVLNTVHWRNTDRAADTLLGYGDAVRFAARVGFLSDDESAAIVRAAARDPKSATAAFARLTQTREVAHRVFVALARGDEPAPAALDALGAAHADAVRGGTLISGPHGFAWSWEETDPWNRVARPLAGHATELLLSPERDRIKECRDDGCGWLFLDHSKNASRRWCSMEICGSRAKMRAHYRRNKAPAP